MLAVGIAHLIGRCERPILPHETAELAAHEREAERMTAVRLGSSEVSVATHSGLTRSNWSSASAQRTRSGTRRIGPVVQTLAPVAAQRAVTTSQFPSQ